MWESLYVHAWRVAFVVAVLAPEAGAQPALPQEGPARAPVAAPPEPVATPPEPAATPEPVATPPEPAATPAIAPSLEPPPSTPESPPVEQPPTRPAYFIARGGVDFGGDDVFKFVNADSTETIQAGQRYFASVGVLYRPDPNGLALEATIGYKWQSSDGPNGTFGISRIPLEVIGSLTTSGFRIGAGVAVHFAPSFHSQDMLGRHLLDLTLDTAFGGMLQLAYHIGDEQGVDLGVRGTYIKYDDRSFTYATYDGTCVGFFMGVWL